MLRPPPPPALLYRMAFGGGGTERRCAGNEGREPKMGGGGEGMDPPPMEPGGCRAPTGLLRMSWGSVRKWGGGKMLGRGGGEAVIQGNISLRWTNRGGPGRAGGGAGGSAAAPYGSSACFGVLGLNGCTPQTVGSVGFMGMSLGGWGGHGPSILRAPPRILTPPPPQFQTWVLQPHRRAGWVPEPLDHPPPPPPIPLLPPIDEEHPDPPPQSMGAPRPPPNR